MGKDLKGKEIGSGLSQRKDGVYCARFVNRFGKRVCLYNKNRSELKDELQKAVYEDKMKVNIVDSSITLHEWFSKWLSVHKYDVTRDSTKSNYTLLYHKHIAPVLGKRKLKEITHLQVKHLINSLDKKGYGFETKNKVRIMILDMYNKAMIDHLVNSNPAKGIKVLRKVSEEDGVEEGKDIRVLTKEEQTEFFDCCKGTFYDNLFTVAVSTGLRIGELAGLKWEDIDFDNMVIHVRRTLLYQKLEELGDTKKTFHFDPPKTKTSKRDVPITKQCKLALIKQKMQKDVVMSKTSKKVEEQFKDLLFTTKFGTPICPQIAIDAIKVIINEINLCKDFLEEFEPFTSHAFRHTFATRCFEAGIQPKTVQAYLGHATLQMTMDLYTSVLKEHSQNEMEKLENKLDDVFNNGDKLTEQRYKKTINNENELKGNVINIRDII